MLEIRRHLEEYNQHLLFLVCTVNPYQVEQSELLRNALQKQVNFLIQATSNQQ